MADSPTFLSSQPVPGAVATSLQPIPIPNLPNEVGGAVSQLGSEVAAFSERMEFAQQTTNHLLRNAAALNIIDAAREKYASDPDWANAGQKFRAEVQSQLGDVAKQYPLVGKWAALSDLYAQRYTIAASHHVETLAHERGFAATDAAIDDQAVRNGNAAVTAGTPAQRQDAIDRQAEAITAAHAAGWYSDLQAGKKMQAFRNGLDHADVLSGIANDPHGTALRLQDPANYPSLTPVQRETYLGHARETADKQGIELARGTVQGAPYAASLIAGQFVDPAHIDQLFDRQVIAQESGGQNAAPNSKGAFGPAQITPAFARDYAGKLSPDMQARLGDPTKLSDAELTDKLMSMPDVSTALGRAGFRALAEKYNGNPVLAMAAYNAGPANADRWQAAAVKQFGPNPTPAQIASVIDIKETSDYVAGIYNKSGARMDAYGVSPGGRWQLGSALGAELTRENVRQEHLTDELAKVGASEDPIPKLLEQGIDVGAERIATYRAQQMQAAAGGNREAAKNLRDLDWALQAKPQVDQLYRLPFPVMMAAVDAAEARAKESGADFAPDQVRTLALLQKTRDAIAKARNEDPTSLIVRAGIDKPVAIDTSADPADPGFRAALQARGAQAAKALDLYQGRALALAPAEAASLKERYAQAPPGEQFALLKSMADTLPPAVYRDTVKEVVGEAPGASLVGEFAASRPELARQMLIGAQILKGEKGTEERGSAVARELENKLGGQVYPTAAQQEALTQGALALDAARRAQGGGLYAPTDTSGVAQAIDDIAGPVIRHNGVNTPLPPTMPQSQAADLINHFDERHLQLAGGAIDRNGQAIAAADLARYGKWRPLEVGGTRYVLDMPAAGGDAPVLDYNGRSLVVDLKAMAELGAAPAAEGDRNITNRERLARGGAERNAPLPAPAPTPAPTPAPAPRGPVQIGGEITENFE